MILGFKIKINGKPSYFVEKIWALLQYRYAEITKEGKRYLMPPEYFECLDKGFENMKPFKPKLHTFREDKKDKWKAGKIIDFFINVRTKDMFRFAPRIPVVSTQKVEIKYTRFVTYPTIYIDGKCFFWNIDSCYFEILELSENDGFDTIADFFAYFNEDFTGKIIHWTDKRY